MNEDIKSDSQLIRLTEDDVILEERAALPAHLRLTGNNDSMAPTTSEFAHVRPGFIRRHAGKSIAFTLSLLTAFSIFGAVRTGLFAGIDPRFDGSTPVAAAKAPPCASGSCVERVSVSAFQRPRATRIDSSAGMTLAREAPSTHVPTLADPPMVATHTNRHATRVASAGNTVSVRPIPAGRPGTPSSIMGDALGAPVATTITQRTPEASVTTSTRPAAEAPAAPPPARAKKYPSLEDELLNASR